MVRKSAKLEIICDFCGNMFLRYPSNCVNNHNFCSKKCAWGGVPTRKVSKLLTMEEVFKEFWSKVDKTPGQGPNGDCWIWTGEIGDRGYGKQWAYPLKKRIPTHRMSYEIHSGELLSSKDFICHRCDNPPCCNPAHLFKGTNKDNMQDMASKGRNAKGSAKKFAKLSEADVYVIRFKRQKAKRTDLAKEFNVTRSVIDHILQGIAWKHVTEGYYDG